MKITKIILNCGYGNLARIFSFARFNEKYTIDERCLPDNMSAGKLAQVYEMFDTSEMHVDIKIVSTKVLNRHRSKGNVTDVDLNKYRMFIDMSNRLNWAISAAL